MKLVSTRYITTTLTSLNTQPPYRPNGRTFLPIRLTVEACAVKTRAETGGGDAAAAGRSCATSR